MLQTHYRAPLDFSFERLEGTVGTLERMKTCVSNLRWAFKQSSAQHELSDADSTLAEAINTAQSEFDAQMDDDFNTALGLSALFDLARDVNTYLREEDHEKAALKEAQDLFDSLLYVFGLDFEAQGTDDALADDLMALLIDLRAQARADKQFALADAIRDRLKDLGIVLEDGKNGTTWKQAH